VCWCLCLCLDLFLCRALFRCLAGGPPMDERMTNVRDRDTVRMGEPCSCVRKRRQNATSGSWSCKPRRIRRMLCSPQQVKCIKYLLRRQLRWERTLRFRPSRTKAACELADRQCLLGHLQSRRHRWCSPIEVGTCMPECFMQMRVMDDCPGCQTCRCRREAMSSSCKLFHKETT